MVKSLNKDAIIVGELWELSPDFVSVNGPFDALMNYNFAFAVNDFMIADKTAITTKEFVNRLDEVSNAYSKENLSVIQNLIGSHDTDRLSSMIKNPDRHYDRDANESNNKYNPGKPTLMEYNMQKLIAAFQMTYRGAPMIYYGDEVGMWGADDPHDRKPMVWDEFYYDDEVIDESSGFVTGFGSYEVSQNIDLLDWYKNLIDIRNNSSALKKGDQKILYVSDSSKSFAFERWYKDERMIIAFNFGNENEVFEIPLNENKIFFFELLSDESGTAGGEDEKAALHINIPRKDVQIYKITTLSGSTNK